MAKRVRESPHYLSTSSSASSDRSEMSSSSSSSMVDSSDSDESMPPAPTAVQFEQQMTDLGLDDDLKESLRSMTPNTRRDIISDIVRDRNPIPVPLPMSGGGWNAPQNSIDDLRDLFFPGLFGSLVESRSASEEPVGAPQPVRGFRMRPPVEEDDGDGMDVDLMPGQLAALLQPRIQTMLHHIAQITAMQSMGSVRDVDDMSYEELLALEEQIGDVSKGLTPEQMKACLIVPTTPPTSTENCPICLEELLAPPPTPGANPTVAGESGSVLQRHRPAALKACGHVFHRDCLKTWLQINKVCPICKKDCV